MQSSYLIVFTISVKCFGTTWWQFYFMFGKVNDFDENFAPTLAEIKYPFRTIVSIYVSRSTVSIRSDLWLKTCLTGFVFKLQNIHIQYTDCFKTN